MLFLKCLFQSTQRIPTYDSDDDDCDEEPDNDDDGDKSESVSILYENCNILILSS